MSATGVVAQSHPSNMPPSSSRRQRPTTYSGPAASSSSQPIPSPTTAHAPPIPPPPRTSSQRQGGSATNSPNLDNPKKGTSSPKIPINERDSSKSDRRNVTSSITVGPSSSSSATKTGSGPSRSESVREPARRRDENGAAPPPVVNSRQDREGHRESRKETKFGNYMLGQTLGEGEFGKVKLGWRRDGGVQVAIKLIRRDTLAPHPNRLSKIYREISILRTLSHPNIVKLHEMVETDRYIGIILEYASGGELFDYILTHRYLKDPPACRLFAQLVSGVGYLHKMGIVHRDLKLENLLLDRNRNIIITDFGFANVFDPKDDIVEYEDKLDDPEVLRDLERGVGSDGRGRRGDLMATSCGSPCYAAPELVVSERVYTGRKVDVWSCGVILYAMLAGYLPFDDDPANPEGDNINLLYKYIVSTPLTFPEYVTPHARDLLRRILVPDPRKRADLFEVARHSWLSPFANVVGLITSSTTSTQDIMTTTVTGDAQDGPLLARSASVREPSTTTHKDANSHQQMQSTHHQPMVAQRHQEHSPSSTTTKTSGDTKRNTVQVEYAPPKSQTKRGDTSDALASPSRSKSAATRSPKQSDKRTSPQNTPRALPDTSVGRSATTAAVHSSKPKDAAVKVKDDAKLDSSKALPHKERQQRAISYHPPVVARPPSPVIEPPPPLPAQQQQYKEKEAAYSSSTPVLPVPHVDQRPTTGDTTQSNVSRSASMRVPSSGSHAKPVAAVASTTARGKLQQPSQKKPYTISHPIPQNPEGISIGQPSSIVPVPGKSQQQQKGQGQNEVGTQNNVVVNDKGHKRANTVGSGGTGDRFFGKILGIGSSSDKHGAASSKRISSSHVVSSNDQHQNQQQQQQQQQQQPIGSGDASGSPRNSIDHGTAGHATAADNSSSNSKSKRRFSLLPAGLLKHDRSHPPVSMENHNDPSHKTSTGKLTKHDRRPSRTASGSMNQDRRGSTTQGSPETNQFNASSQTTPSASSTQIQQQQQQQYDFHSVPPPMPSDLKPPASRKSNTEKRYSSGIPLGKNRKFTERFENENNGGQSGSNSAARRVMDFFRKRAIGRSKN